MTQRLAAPSRRHRGFTLVELLVALFAMALLAVMSWRGLDAMVHVQQQTQSRADEVLGLQVGLAQWAADLDAVVQIPRQTPLEWNGRVLRMTRKGSGSASEGFHVVAWARRATNGTGSWLRWQSPALTTRGQLAQAWAMADLWSQNPGDEERRYEVAVTGLDSWQIFFFVGGNLTNPQSNQATGAAGTSGLSATATVLGTTTTVTTAVGVSPNPASPSAATVVTGVVPDGVRLILVLPPGQPISGTLTRDWLRPYKP